MVLFLALGGLVQPRQQGLYDLIHLAPRSHQDRNTTHRALQGRQRQLRLQARRDCVGQKRESRLPRGKPTARPRHPTTPAWVKIRVLDASATKNCMSEASTSKTSSRSMLRPTLFMSA